MVPSWFIRAEMNQIDVAHSTGCRGPLNTTRKGDVCGQYSRSWWYNSEAPAEWVRPRLLNINRLATEPIMSMPILSPTAVAMSTREIAALCDKAHRHVVRDLKVIADQCDINLPKFGQSYIAGNGQEQTEYLLDRKTTLLLVSGYSAPLRLKIINRLEELEQGTVAVTPPQLPQSKIMDAVLSIEYIMGQVAGVDPLLMAATKLHIAGEIGGFDTEPVRRLLPPHEGAVCNLNATGVGELVGVSAREANLLLVKSGLQYRDARGDWQLTEAGKEYGEARAYTNGCRSGFQLLWKPEVRGALYV